jgi:hypothetical protein
VDPEETDRVVPSKAIHNELPCAIDWLETVDIAAFAVAAKPMSPVARERSVLVFIILI